MNDTSLMTTYGKLPVSFDSGDGCWLFDTDGNKYFDTFMGVAVSGLGHGNTAVAKAIKDQCSRLMHCANVYHSKHQELLADRLCAMSGMQKAFLCNSGSEANETAIKVARKHAYDRGIKHPNILCMNGAYHGRSMACLSASGNNTVQTGFQPLLDGFTFVDLNDIEQLIATVKSTPNLIAIMLEPIQGEDGVILASNEYLQMVRSVCDDYKLLMICDEIQSGNGRTGKFFAYEHSEIEPDIVTLAKGLGNGFPIGACLAKGEAAAVLKPGSHGSTFGGNPLACSAALAVLNEIESRHLIARANDLGKHILQELSDALSGAEYVNEVRGKGLMLGIEMTDPCFALVPLAKEKGLLLNVTSDNVIRLLPALTMSDDECELLIDAIIQIIRLYAADDRAKPRAKS